jgi:hypothetical protein
MAKLQLLPTNRLAPPLTISTLSNDTPHEVYRLSGDFASNEFLGVYKITALDPPAPQVEGTIWMFDSETGVAAELTMAPGDYEIALASEKPSQDEAVELLVAEDSTPVAVKETESEDRALDVVAPTSPPTPTKNFAEPMERSYSDVPDALENSISESTYSLPSANGKGDDDDDQSDRWSVLSTGPVDRQWTVVFEEKEEVV